MSIEQAIISNGPWLVMASCSTTALISAVVPRRQYEQPSGYYRLGFNDSM